eukprot:scaffold353_cov185-Amphora_coffeaeformis.AAC.17
MAVSRNPDGGKEKSLFLILAVVPAKKKRVASRRLLLHLALIVIGIGGCPPLMDKETTLSVRNGSKKVSYYHGITPKKQVE